MVNYLYNPQNLNYTRIDEFGERYGVKNNASNLYNKAKKQCHPRRLHEYHIFFKKKHGADIIRFARKILDHSQC